MRRPVDGGGGRSDTSHPGRQGCLNYRTCGLHPSLPSATGLWRPGKLTSSPCVPGFLFQPRAEAGGLEGAGLEGEAQQRTLPRNQVSTVPFLMDFKGRSGQGQRNRGLLGPRRSELRAHGRACPARGAGGTTEASQLCSSLAHCSPLLGVRCLLRKEPTVEGAPDGSRDPGSRPGSVPSGLGSLGRSLSSAGLRLSL